MKFSPTTLLAYVRFLAVAVLIGHILFMVFAKGVYFIDTNKAIAYLAVMAVIDKLLGVAQSHYTADSPPAPKANDDEGNTGTGGGKVLLALLLPLALAVAFALSGCAGSGEGGAWTPQDTAAVSGALNQGVDTYSRARDAYRGAPTYVNPYAQPVLPVAPVPAPMLRPY